MGIKKGKGVVCARCFKKMAGLYSMHKFTAIDSEKENPFPD